MYQWHQSCHMLSHGTTLSLECLEWTCRTEPRSKPRMCCWLVVRWVWLKLQLRCAEIRTFDSSNYWCLYVQTPSGFQTWQCKKNYHRAMSGQWQSHACSHPIVRLTSLNQMGLLSHILSFESQNVSSQKLCGWPSSIHRLVLDPLVLTY